MREVKVRVVHEGKFYSALLMTPVYSVQFYDLNLVKMFEFSEISIQFMMKYTLQCIRNTG